MTPKQRQTRAPRGSSFLGLPMESGVGHGPHRKVLRLLCQGEGARACSSWLCSRVRCRDETQMDMARSLLPPVLPVQPCVEPGRAGSPAGLPVLGGAAASPRVEVRLQGGPGSVPEPRTAHPSTVGTEPESGPQMATILVNLSKDLGAGDQALLSPSSPETGPWRGRAARISL